MNWWRSWKKHDFKIPIAPPRGTGLRGARMLKHPDKIEMQRTVASFMMLSSLSLMFQHQANDMLRNCIAA